MKRQLQQHNMDKYKEIAEEEWPMPEEEYKGRPAHPPVRWRQTAHSEGGRDTLSFFVTAWLLPDRVGRRQ